MMRIYRSLIILNGKRVKTVGIQRDICFLVHKAPGQALIADTLEGKLHFGVYCKRFEIKG